MYSKSPPKYLLLFLLLLFLNLHLQAKNDTVYKAGLPLVKGLMSVDDQGEIKGFPLEILQELASAEHIQLEWIKGTWPELFNMIKNGELDLLPGTQVTEERNAYLDFLNTPLYTMWSELYILKNAQFKNINALEGKTIALVRSDNNALGFQTYIDRFNIDYDTLMFDSHKQALQALLDEKAYAMAGPASRTLNEPIPGVKSSGLFFNPTNLSVSFPKGENIQLRNRLSKRLQLFKEDPGSVYYQLMRQYGLGRLEHSHEVVPSWVVWTVFLGIGLIAVAILFIVTLRKQVSIKTKALRKNEFFLKRALETGEMGGWIYYPAKDTFFWSQELRQMTGVSSDEFLPKDRLLNSIHEDDRDTLVKAMKQCLQSGDHFDIELRFILKNDEVLYCRMIGLYNRNSSGLTDEVSGIVKNITREKHNQMELIAAKEAAEISDQVKTDFLNNMSHEVRTPMNAIMGFAKLLNCVSENKEKIKKYTGLIYTNSKTLLQIIDNILEISLLLSGQLKVTKTAVDVKKVFTDLEVRYQNEINPGKIALEFRHPEILKNHILIDEAKVTQVIEHLVKNAVRFTTKGEVVVEYYIDGQELLVRVSDTGIGISAERQTEIFQPFVQENPDTKFDYGGLGLGLAIVSNLVELLGGNILLESQKNAGTKVEVTFPFE